MGVTGPEWVGREGEDGRGWGGGEGVGYSCCCGHVLVDRWFVDFS